MLTNFSRLKFFFAVVILVLTDQIFKNAILAFLSSGTVSANNYISWEIYKNYGIVFGIPFPNGLFYFAILIFLILLFAGRFFDHRRLDGRQIIGLVFLLAGAAGNIIDRLRWGYIIDFINVKNVLVFNLADVFIAAGAIMLLEKFFPDTGKGKLKKNFYIFLFIILGVLISFLIHAAVEIWYANLLAADFPKYGLDLNWPQWDMINNISMDILSLGGILFGFLQGKYWWKVLYENR